VLIWTACQPVPRTLGTSGQLGPSWPPSGSPSWRVVHQSGHALVVLLCNIVTMIVSPSG
jgi:hypothetical protein